MYTNYNKSTFMEKRIRKGTGLIMLVKPGMKMKEDEQR
jgi:hypothetical protein